MRNFLFRMAAAITLTLIFLFTLSCTKEPVPEPVDDSPVSLEELAGIFSNLRLGPEHLAEVHTAVCSSVEHGYDEEYTMVDLFNSPGSGVGASPTETKASALGWPTPLRDLITEYLSSAYATRSDGAGFSSPKEYIDSLAASDAQIYWPYSDDWDGTSYPIITFNPGQDMLSNKGWQMSEDGSVKEVVVNEKKAMNGNVWVINRNEDSAYQTLEMLRRQDPDWGKGGSIVVKSGSDEDAGTKSLMLKTFEARRNFDSWFAGGSEFFIRCGAVEDFQASTEAEMRLYSPYITDFMVVVKRNQTGIQLPFNALLVSEWTEQLQSLAFMITEDDGGTRTSWKSSAMVKIQSKSYGFEIELPYNSRDDIVWRGQLSRNYLVKNNNAEGHFGDVYLTFAFE
ncbi:MAG: hypothetical protein Q4G10_00615 [Bacteroidia bacterium]|nr:hypothetical protein [Bacteroidia bacterium]